MSTQLIPGKLYEACGTPYAVYKGIVSDMPWTKQVHLNYVKLSPGLCGPLLFLDSFKIRIATAETTPGHYSVHTFIYEDFLVSLLTGETEAVSDYVRRVL